MEHLLTILVLLALAGGAIAAALPLAGRHPVAAPGDEGGTSRGVVSGPPAARRAPE